MSDDDHAFPRGGSFHQRGMTLRDWFAGMALMSHHLMDETYTTSELAERAYAIADALLTERKDLGS